MGRRNVEPELLHQPGQAGSLAFWKVQHKPGQRRGIDDRMLQRTFEAATHEPRIEGVVAVLDEDSALGETKECPAGVAKLWCSYQHRPVNVVPLFGIRVDGGAAVDKGVEEGQGT